jgi:hypothetical protein
MFSSSYSQARQRFLAAARAAGARLTTHRNDTARGPGAEDLCTDVAWLGPDAATRVLVAISGTHGVEGYCGSACQLSLLADGQLRSAPPDTAFLLVHALNPYGFAYDRRVNEDNVDLNRNFVDHGRPPVNPHYGELHPLLVPAGWEGDARKAADTHLFGIAAAKGARHVQSVVTGGQWTHPDGLFYGGTAPVWSGGVLRDVVRSFLPGRERIGYIDLHTGLGERAVGEPIFRGGRDAGALARATAWYGAQLSRSEDGTSSSTEIVGNTATLVADEVGSGTELTAITLEFGTLAGPEVLNALRADNWLSLQDDVRDDLRAAIKQQIRDAFAPDAPDWQAAVLARSAVVFGQALAGLAAP